MPGRIGRGSGTGRAGGGRAGGRSGRRAAAGCFAFSLAGMTASSVEVERPNRCSCCCGRLSPARAASACSASAATSAPHSGNHHCGSTPRALSLMSSHIARISAASGCGAVSCPTHIARALPMPQPGERTSRDGTRLSTTGSSCVSVAAGNPRVRKSTICALRN
ncbi:MAG: hypothetical protein E6J87_04405 [Deltaproteobacteria bacterium]|nr:MAG: hypothetical protein E6J87_04405 [Deltaproteobacteria bacterium]